MAIEYSWLRRPHPVWVLVCGFALISILSCKQEELSDNLDQLPGGGSSEYWYTRTRSAKQQSNMLRSHAVGFSYDAIYGEICDQKSVRCQVLDLDELDARDIYDENGITTTNDNFYTAHSISESFSKIENSSSTSANLFLYKNDAKNIAALLERREDDVVIISQTRVCQSLEKLVDMDDFKEALAKDSDPYRILSPSFRYAIDKLKRNDNIAVVDSFIDIFGSHVVIQASVGGRMKLDLMASMSDVKTLESEKRISSSSINLLFKKKTSSTSSELQVFFDMLLKNAELSLSVKGGDVSAFNEIVANPHGANRSPNLLTDWMASFDDGSSTDWSSQMELADMKVAPIWEFIPDRIVAARVRARIEATAPTMQELYGKRNFIDVQLPSYMESVSCKLGGKQKRFDNPYVVDLFAANRHVATLCKEWVPEIDSDNAVIVAYPIYENEIQLDAGVCLHGDVAYNVRWLYGRFSVDTLSVGHKPGDRLYLQSGFIQAKPHGLVKSYLNAKAAIGYEWPGSIDIDGSLRDRPYYETRKLLGDFYLNTIDTFNDLPSWQVKEDGVRNSYYDSHLDGSRPYEICGLPKGGGWNRMKGRMVRKADYFYFYNPTELQW